MIKRTLAGLVLASSGLFTAGASANIWDWDFETDGGFNTAEGVTTCDNGATQAACNLTFASGITPSSITGTKTIMSWGTPASASNGGNGFKSALQGVFGASGQGAYDAQNFGSGPIPIAKFQQMETNKGWINTGVGIHYNNVITANGGALDKTRLETTFRLLGPFTSQVYTADIGIVFNETLNSAPCSGANLARSICDDIFTFSATLAPIVFSYNGQIHTISFRIIGGPGSFVSGGDTIFTSESSTSLFFIQGRIDSPTTVPVPGVLALMGMGLVTLGWRARRRKLV